MSSKESYGEFWINCLSHTGLVNAVFGFYLFSV